MLQKNIKDKIWILRRSGKSYSEIQKILGIANKSTVSYWLRGLKLSPKEESALKTNLRIAHKRGLFHANKTRHLRVSKENKKWFTYGKRVFNTLDNNNKMLAILAAGLYWAEGTKVIDQHRTPSLIFSNSDPAMISIFMKFIRIILRVPEIKIRSGIHLYSSTEIDKARKFWSKITKLPSERFYIITQISRASKLMRGNTLPRGTLALKINSRKEFYIVMGMIASLKKNI